MRAACSACADATLCALAGVPLSPGRMRAICLADLFKISAAHTFRNATVGVHTDGTYALSIASKSGLHQAIK